MTDTPSFVMSTHLDSAGEVSEDTVEWTQQAFWVIDSATGLMDVQYSTAATDGVWFANRFSDYLRDRVDQLGRDLTHIVQDCVTEVSEDFDSLTNEAVPEEAKPSGALALVRKNGDRIESFTLGDCSIVHRRVDGSIETQFGEGPRELDEKVVETMKPMLQSDEYTYQDARDSVSELLVEHRRMKNEEGGYWTLGLDPTAVSNATVEHISRNDLSRSYVFSDGFEPVVDTYDMFVDWKAATNYLNDNGGERAFRLLRAVEEADGECKLYPRLKPKDDAALGILSY